MFTSFKLKSFQLKTNRMLYGIREEVADAVNRDKDAPSRIYPGCLHHGFNHGIGTNLKYFRFGRGNPCKVPRMG